MVLTTKAIFSKYIICPALPIHNTSYTKVTLCCDTHFPLLTYWFEHQLVDVHGIVLYYQYCGFIHEIILLLYLPYLIDTAADGD